MRGKTSNTVLTAANGFIPAAGAITLDFIFRPFEYLDLTRLYEHYSVIIDLFIFILIFVGISQVTLAKRYPGRGGRAVIAGIGILLAIAMVMAEQRFGFNIKSFGPIAACILILLIGIVIYQLLHYAGMTRLRAAALAFIAIFLTMLAMVPNLFTWFDETMPFLSVILVMIFLLAVVGVASSLWAHGGGTKVFKERLQQARASEPERKREREAVNKEARFIKHRVKPIAKKAAKGSEEILEDLESVEDAIRRYGHIPKERRIIIDQINKIIPKEHELKKSIQNLRIRNDQLLRLDTSLFSEKSRQKLKEMSHDEKTLLKKELRDEVERMGLEKRALEIEEALSQHIDNVSRNLSDTISQLDNGQIQEALGSINNAITSEKGISEQAKEVQKLERKLLGLTKRDVRIEKRMNSN